MDSNGVRWDADGDYQPPQSTKKDSREPSRRQEDDNNDDDTDKNITWHSDSEQDRLSTVDGRRSTSSFYSDEYESRSEGTRSPDSQSRIPCHSSQRRMQAKTSSSIPFNKKGYVGRPGACRQEHSPCLILGQQHRKGARLQTKEYTPCKDLDMATKKLLSSRLLKINELKNAHAELQQQYDSILVENRTLRQVQARLQHHNDTESQVAQLMSRHSKETHVYHERLRRCHEQIRALEQKLKDKEAQLQKEQAQLKKSRATITQLRRLLARDDLETRDELSQMLEKEKSRAQAAEEKRKEVEHIKELSSNLYQRQLAAERRKTFGVLEENQSLRQTMEELTQKLRKKERELGGMNIYANRVLRRDAPRKQKVTSRNSTKAAESTRGTATPDFPTPPPAITDGSQLFELFPDEYLSLKKLIRGEKPTKAGDRSEKQEEQRVEDKDKTPVEKEQEKEEKRQTFQEPRKPLTPAQRPEREEKDRGRAASAPKREEEDQVRPSRVHELATNRFQEAAASRDVVESRRRKDQVLAKMREIDFENHVSQRPALGMEGVPTVAADAGGTEGGRRSGVEGTARGAGRRALQSPGAGDDLLFGSYTPSFINPHSQRSPNFPAAPAAEKRDGAFETGGPVNSRGVEAERMKVEEHEARPPNLLQQLFGSNAVAERRSIFDNVDVREPPPATNGTRSTRERPLSFNPPQPTVSRPTIRAFTSFDADIEELTL